MLQRLLRGEQKSQDVKTKLSVEMILRDIFERKEFEDARIINEHIHGPERFLRFREKLVDVSLFGDVRLYCDSLAACTGYICDDLVGAFLAGSIVNDDCGTFGGEMFGDGSTNALGGSGDDGDFSCEFL